MTKTDEIRNMSRSYPASIQLPQVGKRGYMSGLGGAFTEKDGGVADRGRVFGKRGGRGLGPGNARGLNQRKVSVSRGLGCATGLKPTGWGGAEGLALVRAQAASLPGRSGETSGTRCSAISSGLAAIGAAANATSIRLGIP